MCVGFLLAGIGEEGQDEHKSPNYLVVSHEMPESQIITFFTALMERKDIAIVLVSVDVADRIRPTMTKYRKTLIPNVLEIPSKSHPYSLAEDEIVVLAMVGILFYFTYSNILFYFIMKTSKYIRV